VAVLQKEALRLAADKEDLEVERVLISQSENQLKAKQEELTKAKAEIDEAIKAFEKAKNETQKQIEKENQSLEQKVREHQEKDKDLDKRLAQLQDEKAKWDKQKQFDIEQITVSQEQFEQKRSREENEAFSRKKSLQAQEEFQRQKEDLLSKRESQVRHLEEQARKLDEQANQLQSSLEQLRNLELDLETAVSEFADQKELSLSEFERVRFQTKEKENSLQILQTTLDERQTNLDDFNALMDLEREEFTKRQKAHAEAVESVRLSEEKFTSEMNEQNAQLAKGLEDFRQQREALDKDQVRLVEEWDSLEQMNVDFTEQSIGKQEAHEEREKQLVAREASLDTHKKKLQDWSNCLLENQRKAIAEQYSLSKNLRSIRRKKSQLGTEKRRIIHARIHLDKQQSHVAEKNQKISKLAKEFLSIIEE